MNWKQFAFGVLTTFKPYNRFIDAEYSWSTSVGNKTNMVTTLSITVSTILTRSCTRGIIVPSTG